MRNLVLIKWKLWPKSVSEIENCAALLFIKLRCTLALLETHFIRFWTAPTSTNFSSADHSLSTQRKAPVGLSPAPTGVCSCLWAVRLSATFRVPSDAAAPVQPAARRERRLQSRLGLALRVLLLSQLFHHRTDRVRRGVCVETRFCAVTSCARPAVLNESQPLN